MKLSLSPKDDPDALWKPSRRPAPFAGPSWMPTRRRDFLRLRQPRRAHDWALLSIIQEAYVAGTATRHLESVATALGSDGADDLQPLARELDRRTYRFRTRPLLQAYPYLVLEGVFQKVHEQGRLSTSVAAFVGGITPDGGRELIAVEVGNPDDPRFWKDLFAGLRARGVFGVRLCTADPWPGLEDAIANAFPAASWQWSRRGFIARALELAGRARAEVSPALRDVFHQPDRAGAHAALARLQRAHGWNEPLATMLRAGEEAVLASYDVPTALRVRVSSTTCLQRPRAEILRHCRLIGVFPSEQALLRLVAVMLDEQNAEWASGPRYIAPSDGLLLDAEPARPALAVVPA